ncbi:MAG: DUF6328 family protein [Solirubrobacteraceae bacterium]
MEGRHESDLERLDRNTTELIGELRVAATGVQVLLAFLLTVPFSSGYNKLTGFDRHTYYVTLLCVAGAAVLLIAPSVHHRVLFRHSEKAFIVRAGNRCALWGGLLLLLGMCGMLTLISRVMFSSLLAAVVGPLAGLSIGWLWFGVPITRRLRHPSETSREGRLAAER